MVDQLRVNVVRATSDDVPSYSIPGVFDELRRGRARIGWSYDDHLDLRLLEKKLSAGEPFDDDEQRAKRCLGFLNYVRPGDYLIYPQQPKYGQFSVVRVTGEYDYASADDSLEGDFRSYRPCELLRNMPVSMTDAVVPPQLRTRLGRPGRLSMITDVDPFQHFLEHLDGVGQPEGDENDARIDRITERLKEQLPSLIRQQFPQHDLTRRFCHDLFERMALSPTVQEGPAEHGSDVIALVAHPLLKDEFQVGVQAFAYEGAVTENALREKLNQLVSGWDTNALDYGALLTTGNCNEEAVELVRKWNEENRNRPVVLIDGPGLAELFLRYFYMP